MVTQESVTLLINNTVNLYYKLCKEQYVAYSNTCPVETTSEACFCLTIEELYAICAYSLSTLGRSKLTINSEAVPISVKDNSISFRDVINSIGLHGCVEEKKNRNGLKLPSDFELIESDDLDMWYFAFYAIWVLDITLSIRHMKNTKNDDPFDEDVYAIICAGLMRRNVIFAHEYFHALAEQIIEDAKSYNYNLVISAKKIVKALHQWNVWENDKIYSWIYDVKESDWATHRLILIQNKFGKDKIKVLESYLQDNIQHPTLQFTISKDQDISWVTQFIKHIDDLDVTEHFSIIKCVNRMKKLKQDYCEEFPGLSPNASYRLI